MKNVYSTYEAKARLSEILRGVRERGESAVVTYHGEPIAEIRPIERSGDPLQVRLDAARARGALHRGPRRGALEPMARRSGALARFLRDRDQ